jgi:hypothetical protein
LVTENKPFSTSTPDSNNNDTLQQLDIQKFSNIELAAIDKSPIIEFGQLLNSQE